MNSPEGQQFIPQRHYSDIQAEEQSDAVDDVAWLTYANPNEFNGFFDMEGIDTPDILSTEIMHKLVDRLFKITLLSGEVADYYILEGSKGTNERAEVTFIDEDDEGSSNTVIISLRQLMEPGVWLLHDYLITFSDGQPSIQKRYSVHDSKSNKIKHAEGQLKSSSKAEHKIIQDIRDDNWRHGLGLGDVSETEAINLQNLLKASRIIYTHVD